MLLGVVEMNNNMRYYPVIFVVFLFVLSSCALADQVNYNRFVSPGPDTGLTTGFSTAQHMVQAASTPTTTGLSATYSPGGVTTRFELQAVADEGDKAKAITTANSAGFSTVGDNYSGTSTNKSLGGATGTNTGGQSQGIITPRSFGSNRNATGATLSVNAYTTGSVTKSPVISKDTSTTNSKLPQSGSNLLLIEAEREFSRMTSSYYTHTTYVDEKAGTYNYDCSGFVGYALSRAVPGAFNALQHKRPVAADFYDHIVVSGPVPGSGGWMKVSTPLELLPGDIVVWLKPDSSDSTSTGHVMIVTGMPVKNPQRTGEVLVQVIDSTESGHANDTRGSGQTGLGKGTIGIMTDLSGLPTGYYWRGGDSRLLQKTDIAFGRIA